MGLSDSLKATYDSIEEAYYNFAEMLQQKGIPFMDYFVTPIESRGIPSMPVFVLILVALFSAVLVAFIYSGSSVGSKTLTVSVTSLGQPLDGVNVQVLYQNSIVAKGVTHAGSLQLAGVPSAVLSVRVSKAAFRTVILKVLPSQTSVKTELVATAPGTEDSFLNGTDQSVDNSSQLVVTVLDYQNQQPISDAQVLYVSDQVTGQLATDGQGQAVLPSAPLMNLRVSKSGYKTETLSVKDGGPVTVHLKSLDGGAVCFGDTCGTVTPNPSSQPACADNNGSCSSLSTNGLVSVVLNSTSGPLDGHVRLYGADGTLLSEEDTVSGVANFTAALGQSVFVTAQVPNFPLYDGQNQSQVVTALTQFIVTLVNSSTPPNPSCSPDSCLSGLDTVIRAVDSSGNNLTFTAEIYAPPLIVLGTNTTDRWELPVQPGTYYVYIKSDGYLEQTGPLLAGKENVFTLAKASPFNSAALKVSVQDEYSQAIVGATVLLLSNNKLASPAQVTDAQGQVSFPEMAIGPIDVNASFNGKVASAHAQIQQGGSAVVLNMTIHRALIKLSVTNAVGGSPVVGQISLTALDQNPVSTAGSSAVLDAPSKIESQLSVSASGFIPFFASLSLDDGETRVVNAVLVPTSATQGASITCQNQNGQNRCLLRASDGSLVSSMQAGSSYVLELNVTPAAQAGNQSVYVRVGSQSTADQDVALVTDYSSADSVLKSVSYQPSSVCTDLTSNLVSATDGYKWVYLQFKQPGTRIVSFVIQVKASASSNQKLPLFFATDTQSGSVGSRDPPDDNPTACYPKAYEYDVPIVASTSTPTPNPSSNPGPNPSGTPTPSVNPIQGLNFTSSVNIHYDPVSNKVVADVPEVDLQIDPIYPSDTVPLTIDDAHCSIVAKIESSQSDCYSVSHSALTFKTKEFGTSCNSYVKDNAVILAKDSPVLVLSAITCPGAQSARLPVVINVQAENAVSTAPTTLDPGDHTAKLAYVLNQKQFGDLLLTPLPGQGTISVAAHSASVFSWSGPGSLSLQDGDTTVGSWTYSTAPAYFDGIGSVGPRVDSASDYLGCAQGWCSGPAVLQALQFFKTQAQTVAAQTQFRRSGIVVTPQPTIAPTTTPVPTVTPNPTSSPSTISIQVLSPTGSSIPGTTAQLYSFVQPLQSVSNAVPALTSGNVSFSVSSNVQAYALITAPGYLPLDFFGGGSTGLPLPVATPLQAVLTPSSTSNHGSLSVKVVDSSGKPVPGATVLLDDPSGFLAAPSALTGTDGTTVFANLPLKSLQALVSISSQSSQNGQSAYVQISQQPASVTVTMSSATATATPTASPTASATASATASPTSSPTVAPGTLTLNYGVLAKVGNEQLNLSDVSTLNPGSASSPLALIDVLDASGNAITSLDKQKGDPAYNGNGFQLTIVNVVWKADPTQRSAQVQVTNTAHASAVDSVGLSSSAPDFSPLAFKSGSSLQFSPLYFDSAASGTPFVFSTVVQSTESADKAFDILGFTRQGPSCNGQPGVYLVQASTTDGKNFQYTTQVMRLAQSPDGKVSDQPLCGFIYAQGQNILTSPVANLAAIGQASDDHVKPKTQIAIFTMAPIEAAICSTTSASITTLEKEVAALKSDMDAANKLGCGQTQDSTSTQTTQQSDYAILDTLSASAKTKSTAPCPPTQTEPTCKAAYLDASGFYSSGVASKNDGIQLAQKIVSTYKRICQDLAAPVPPGKPLSPVTGGVQKSVEALKSTTAPADKAVTSLHTFVDSFKASKSLAESSSNLANSGYMAANSKTVAGFGNDFVISIRGYNAAMDAAASQIHTVRLEYDAKVKALTAARQKCDGINLPLFEIPPGLVPQMSQLRCASDLPGKLQTAINEAKSKVKSYKKEDQTVGGELYSDFQADSDKLAGLLQDAAKFQGCRAVCEAKPACIEMFPNGNQMTQIIHLGLSEDCMPFSSTAAMDLAKSFVVGKLMQGLGPYAQMAMFTAQAAGGAGLNGMGGGCGFAQGYFMQNNLNGRGMTGGSSSASASSGTSASSGDALAVNQAWVAAHGYTPCSPGTLKSAFTSNAGCTQVCIAKYQDQANSGGFLHSNFFEGRCDGSMGGGTSAGVYFCQCYKGPLDFVGDA